MPLVAHAVEQPVQVKYRCVRQTFSASFQMVSEINSPQYRNPFFTCAISGYWLSPDADVDGYLNRRYGMLQFIWWPYYSLSHMGGHYRVHGKATHRSHLSHSPLIGSLSKVLYLAAIALLISQFIGVELQAIARFMQSHSSEIMVGAIALEVGSLVHIVSDWVWSELH
jgi:uncharacterized metal-binding protein